MGLNPEINRIIVASTSDRRKAFAGFAFGGMPIECHPAGDEPDIPSVTSVMHGKLDFVLNQLKENNAIQTDEPALIIAADTRTATVCLLDEGKRIGLQSRGKPKTDDMVRDVFTSMAEAAFTSGVHPIYMVESASGSHLVHQSVRRQVSRHCVVELDTLMVAGLATKEGFEIYKQTFCDFYNGPAYEHHDLPPLRITDVSGGLSLPVLIQLGAVRSIDRVSVDDPQFVTTLKRAIFTVAIGLDAKAWGDTSETENLWPWGDEMVRQILDKKHI